MQFEGKHYLWALLPTALATIVLVWAEERSHWDTAQASLVCILLLLALMIWAWWRSGNPRPHLSREAAAYDRAIRKLLLLVTIGFIALLLNAIRFEHWQQGRVARAIGYAILIAGSFFVSGLLFGYLFGLPAADSPQSSGAQSSSALPHPRTNLEEIADWLTKLILGASLVSLSKLQNLIGQFAGFVARGVDPEPQGSPAVALGIMGFFSASGLLYGYLWTRYIHEIEVSDTSVADASALASVDHWLNAAAPDDQVRVDMMSAIKDASLAAKVRIFRQAEQYRKPSTEDVNGRSLPIFQALVEADRQEIFHRNRSQYALALMGRKKDPKNPDDDWKRALDLLNNAIRIRDGSGETDWHEYELARAVCQIYLDTEFNAKHASTPEQKQSILADLETAKDVPEATSKQIDGDNVIETWKALNPN